MKTIKLNGDPCTLGVDTVITIGYNMKGKRCITKGILNRSEDTFYISMGSIDVWVRNIDDIYLDTTENRGHLKTLLN